MSVSGQVVHDATDREETARALRRVPLFDAMSTEALAGLAAAAQRKECVRGETIWGLGEAHGPVYVLVAGSARLYYLASTGQGVTLDILQVGDLCGLLADRIASLPIAAQILSAGTILYRLPRTDLSRLLATSPAVAAVVLEQAWSRLDRLYERMGEMGNCVKTRVARALAEMSRVTSDSDVRITREQLGEMVGARRESVTRALDTLRAEGFVAYEPGQRVIVVRDPERLALL